MKFPITNPKRAERRLMKRPKRGAAIIPGHHLLSGDTIISNNLTMPHVEMSVAAGGRNAAVARGGDGLIRARHRQLQLRLDESQFGRLALDPQTLRQPVQTPDVVQVTFRPNQYPIEA